MRKEAGGKVEHIKNSAGDALGKARKVLLERRRAHQREELRAQESSQAPRTVYRIVDPQAYFVRMRDINARIEAEERARRELERSQRPSVLDKIAAYPQLRGLEGEAQGVITAIAGISEGLSVPVKIHAAASLITENTATSVQTGILVITAESEEREDRLATMDMVHQRLEARRKNRDMLTAGIKQGMQPEMSVPHTDVLLFGNKNNKRPVGLRSRYYDYLSMFTMRDGGRELHVYLGLMPGRAIEGKISAYGNNVTCLADITREMLHGYGSERRIGSGDY